MNGNAHFPNEKMNLSKPSSASSVESAFRPALDEIARRSAAARSCPDDLGKATTYFSKTHGASGDQLEAHQRHVLLSLGTAVLAPRPVDHSRPAVRIYGGFQSREEALEHAQEVLRPIDPACSLIIARLDAWVLLPLTEAVRDDPEEAQRRIDRKLDAHRANLDEQGCTFESAVRDHVERPEPKREDAEDPETRRDYEEAEALVYKPLRRLRAGGEVRGQSYAVICVHPDEFGECLVRVLGCFESTAAAEAWVRNVGTQRITDHDLFVVPTCEWFYPNAKAGKGGNEHYRIDELQRIMDAASKNPEVVQSYKDWKAEQDRIRAEADKMLPPVATTPESSDDGGNDGGNDGEGRVESK